jgi:heme-degrading monooxygenase HmoA
MIARVWRGETRAADADRYLDYLRRTGLADCRATPGNRGVQIHRRVEGERAEFVFTSFWDSMGSIRGFAGDDVHRARYYPEDREMLLALPPDIDHFEVVADER